MPTVIARHKVENFDTWLKGHQDRVDLFAPAISGFQTFQDANDPKSVVLVLEVTDPVKLASIINDPANANIKTKHTVVDPIILSMPVSV